MTQYNLPPNLILQQSKAKDIGGDVLESYGKHAAAMFSTGRVDTLNEAVVQTIKTAGLGPEQVKRVIEFTNTNAFLTEFKKESEYTKYVDFDTGLADYNHVIQDLNDGGGGSVYDKGSGDYSHSPSTMRKVASWHREALLEKNASVLGIEILEEENPADALLKEAFSASNKVSPLKLHNPMYEVEALRAKLASDLDVTVSQLSEYETLYLDTSKTLLDNVKQAALEGIPLGYMIQAWDKALNPDPEIIKAAFAYMSPDLKKILGSFDSVGASLEKSASQHLLVNDEHPLIASFASYSAVLTKIAELRNTQEELVDGIHQLDSFHNNVTKNYGDVL